MSALPLFYFPGLQNATGIVDLDEEIKRHAVTVLRMNIGELLLLTDGKGYTSEARIAIATKKQLAVDLLERTAHPAPPKKMLLGISLLKNTARLLINHLCQKISGTRVTFILATKWSTTVVFIIPLIKMFRLVLILPTLNIGQ
jgi:16S rRNA U1498 N3-methylase RsmE